MRNQLIKRGLPVLLASLAVVVVAAPAWAYIDPGTTSAVFGSVGYLLALGGAALGFLAWPIKRLIGAVRRNKKSTDESGE